MSEVQPPKGLKEMTFMMGASVNVRSNRVRAEFAATISVATDEDPQAAFAGLQRWVKGKVRAEVQEAAAFIVVTPRKGGEETDG